MTMDWKQRKADPRWVRAGVLFDTEIVPMANWGNSHAQDSIRFAVCSSALSPEESGYDERHDTLLENTVRQYFRNPSGVAKILGECQRIVRSAQLAGRENDHGE
jgi:hypothetical protein